MDLPFPGPWHEGTLPFSEIDTPFFFLFFEGRGSSRPSQGCRDALLRPLYPRGVPPPAHRHALRRWGEAFRADRSSRRSLSSRWSSPITPPHARTEANPLAAMRTAGTVFFFSRAGRCLPQEKRSSSDGEVRARSSVRSALRTFFLLARSRCSPQDATGFSPPTRTFPFRSVVHQVTFFFQRVWPLS